MIDGRLAQFSPQLSPMREGVWMCGCVDVCLLACVCVCVCVCVGGRTTAHSHRSDGTVLRPLTHSLTSLIDR